MPEWTDARAAGVAELDEQHRALFGIRNELGRANAAGPVEAERAFPATIGKLRSYATASFTAEELCLISCRCEGRQESAQAHQDLLAALGRAEERIAGEGPTAGHAQEVHRLLVDWDQRAPDRGWMPGWAVASPGCGRPAAGTGPAPDRSGSTAGFATLTVGRRPAFPVHPVMDPLS